MRRAYVDVSHFRSPYDSPTLSLSGLGQAVLPTSWPRGRSYVDVAHFRAPYDQGYFQDNQLFGLGDEPVPVVAEQPSLLKAVAYDVLGWGIVVAAAAGVGLGLGLGWQAAKKFAGNGSG